MYFPINLCQSLKIIQLIGKGIYPAKAPDV